MIFALVLSFLLTVQDSRSTVQEVHANGTPKAEYQVLETAEGARVRDGSYRAWSEAGMLVAEGHFERGFRTGEWKLYAADGSLASTGPYVENERHGEWKLFYASGAPRGEGEYENGFKSGRWAFWNEDGKKDRRNSGRYDVARDLHADGASTIWTEKSGKRHGRWLRRDANERPLEEGNFVGGERSGAWTKYWPGTSQVQLNAEYERDKPTGTWLFWHANGLLEPAFGSCVYEEGKARALTIDEIAAVTQPDLGTLPKPKRTPVTPYWAKFFFETEQKIAKGERPTEPLNSYFSAAGFAGTPTLINMLATLDMSDVGDAGFAQSIALELLPTNFFGHGFGWTKGTDEASINANRLTLARWHSAWDILRADRRQWFALSNQAAPQEGQPSPALLSLSLIPVEVSAADLLAERKRDRDLDKLGADGTHEALADALDWLVRHQRIDGSWSSDQHARRCTPPGTCTGSGWDRENVGITSLALLALLGATSDLAQNPHLDAIVEAVDWLLLHQHFEINSIFEEETRSYVYSHAIATLALAAAVDCGYTPARDGLERAVGFILRARNPYGAWRYDVPPVGDNDTSVTAWMVHALALARHVGVEVDPTAFEHSVRWVDEMTDRANGRVGYTELGSPSSRIPDVNDEFTIDASEALTAAGLMIRQFVSSGATEIKAQHADLLLTVLPEAGELNNDMYYWYHGTYALFRMGETYFKPWNKALKDTILPLQANYKYGADEHCSHGSWAPTGPWGVIGGRVYSTALMALCLEVYFRYPLDKFTPVLGD